MPALLRKISIALLIAVFALCVYRARTQPLTVDEAHVFRLFVNRDLSTMAREFDACNHVLHTLLTKFFRWTIGISEFELRLSSLAGCLLYLTAVYRLSALCFGGRWMQPLMVALLTLSPLVLDFLVASRGYGMALGFLLWSLYCACVYWTRGRETRWLWRSGVMAGLAIASNLTLLVPVVALGIVQLLMAVRYRWRGVWAVMDGYAGPAMVVAFVIVVLPLLRARPESFYYGVRTFGEAWEVLIRSALIKTPGRVTTELVQSMFPFLERAAVPVVCLALIAGAVVALVRFVRQAEPVPYKLAPYVLFAATLSVSALLVWILRRFGVLYPLGRTGLYFIPLVLFPLVSVTALPLPPRLNGLRWGAGGVSVLLAALFATQLDTRFFTEWRFDNTGRLLRRLEDEKNRGWRENRQIVLGVTPVVEPTVEYYRIRRNIHWLGQVVTRDWKSVPADYYLLLPQDYHLIGELGLEAVHTDTLSEMMLLRRRR